MGIRLSGGGIYGNSSSPEAHYSIIWGNVAPDGGQNLKPNSSNFTFSHSLIEGSGGSGDDWIMAFGTDGGGNIDADPDFLGAKSAYEAPTADGDYRIADTSPAIDAGDDSVIDLSAVPTDLAGNSRM